jgi:hypothetical protein
MSFFTPFFRSCPFFYPFFPCGVIFLIPFYFPVLSIFFFSHFIFQSCHFFLPILFSGHAIFFLPILFSGHVIFPPSYFFRSCHIFYQKRERTVIRMQRDQNEGVSLVFPENACILITGSAQ